MSSRRALSILFASAAALGALHLAMAAVLELSPDEAYYWTWSRDLGFSYRDHPPMVAWLIRAGTALFGDGEVGVRSWFAALGTALGPLAFAIGRTLGLGPGAALAVAAALGTSLLASAGALLATPETPLAFGWSLGLLGLARAASGRVSRGSWALVAAGTAVALLSKLTGLLLPVVAVAWLLGTADGRRLRRSAAPWIALAAGLAAAAPVLLAGAASGGGAAAFQISHGLWSSGPGAVDRLLNLGAYVGGQIGLLTPLTAVGVVVFAARRPEWDGRWSLPWLAAVVPWTAFAAASLLAPPEANWPAVAHVGGLIGAGLAVRAAAARGAWWARRRWIASAMALQVAVVVAVHVHAVRPFLPAGAAPAGPFEGPTDPASRLHGWRDLVAALERRGDLVTAGWYGIEAELAFYGGPRGPSVVRPADAAAVRGFEGWWIGPSRGLDLPGRRAPGIPPGCRAAEPPAGRVDPGLAAPSAPVRILWIACR